jgi:hypothetical protein
MLPRKFEVDFKEEISMCYMCVPAWLLPIFLKAWESVALDNLNKIKVREAKSTNFTLYFVILFAVILVKDPCGCSMHVFGNLIYYKLSIHRYACCIDRFCGFCSSPISPLII